jgi:hypothetical protein
LNSKTPFDLNSKFATQISKPFSYFSFQSRKASGPIFFSFPQLVQLAFSPFVFLFQTLQRRPDFLFGPAHPGDAAHAA